MVQIKLNQGLTLSIVICDPHGSVAPVCLDFSLPLFFCLVAIMLHQIGKSCPVVPHVYTYIHSFSAFRCITLTPHCLFLSFTNIRCHI